MNLNEWQRFLEEKFQDVPREYISFLSLEALPRLMYILDNQRHLCPECSMRFDKLLSLIIELPGWISTNSPEADFFRKELNNTTKHLETQHALYPKGLWLSRVVGIGIIVGVVTGFIIYVVLENVDLSGFLILGSALGMIIGWIGGKIKEFQLKKDGKLY